MVPLAGIEPALLAELDFESSASTSSATGANAVSASNAAKRADYSGQPIGVNWTPWPMPRRAAATHTAV